MNIENTYMKFTTDYSNEVEYVTIENYYNSPPDSFQGDLSDELYQWIDDPRGWAFYPIK